MKDRLIVLNAAIKTKLGLCCSKGCFHKAVADVSLPQVNVKRGLCNKHLKELRKHFMGGKIIMEVEQ